MTLINYIYILYNKMLSVDNIKTIITIITIFGILLVIIDLARMTKTCPPDKVIYRFVPRTFKEEQETPISIKDIFGDMFDNPSPWIGSINLKPYIRKLGDVTQG